MVKVIKSFFENVLCTTQLINQKDINSAIILLLKIKKKKGRVFFLGVGGSAANSSHAVNDFRKLCNIQCYTPSDNVSELTARTNDDGWDSTFVEWLKVSKLSSKDSIFIFSVGGGNLKKKVSVNIVNAIKFAKLKKSKIISIVGKNDGYAFFKSDVSILVPIKDKKYLTPISESFQSIIWHCIVSDPRLSDNKTKW